MLKIIYFISSHCLLLAGNDRCSKTISGSSGRCLPVPPSLLQAAGEPRWGLPTPCPAHRAPQSCPRAGHSSHRAPGEAPGCFGADRRATVVGSPRGDAGPVRGGRWQQAVPGSCCPCGELAPARVPPSRSAGR